MDKGSQKRNRKLTLMRTIDHKRTISSQHSHMMRNGRKYTLENNDVKYKPYNNRLSSISRKNQSLPRALSSLTQNKNIRSRKLNFNALQMVKSSQKLQPQSSQLKLSGSEKIILEESIHLYQQSQHEQVLEKLSLIKTKHNQVEMYLGLSHFHLKNLDKSIYHLSQVVSQTSEQEVYSALTTAYETTKNYICALNTLNQWIEKFNDNPEAYLLRARIHIVFKEYEKALHDYQMCYHYNPSKLEAYIQEAEILYKISGIAEALEKYNLLLVNYKQLWPSSQYRDINYVKYRKSVLLIQQKQYTPALKLLKTVDNEQLRSEVFYYIGIIYSILGNMEQATISYQKSIQANTSQKFLRQSYYEKFVLMFKKNDFYGIQHELDLIKSKIQQNQSLEFMRKVIEGIIYLLKMNFIEGIQILTQCCDDALFKKNEKIYKNIVLSFLGFGYYSIRNFKQCLRVYDFIGKKCSESNQYNVSMAKGIILTLDRQFSQAMNHFVRADHIEPYNSHTNMVKAVTQILFYNNLQRKQKSKKSSSNSDILLSAQELLSKCLVKERENDQILYIISTICYELQQYDQGLKFIRKAIEASDDHAIKHYYLKANLKVMLDMHEQAINDYTNAIIVTKEQESLQSQKQKLIPQCFLQRAICFLAINNKDKAQNDLRVYFSELENVKKNKEYLDLFMYVGGADVIIEIYQKILHQQMNLHEKMKCFYLAKQLNLCLQTMDSILKLQSNLNLEKDRICLSALKMSSQGSDLFLSDALDTFQTILNQHIYGQIFTKADCTFYAGVMCFYLRDYSRAKNYFIDAKAEKSRKNQLANSENQDYQNKVFSSEQINYNIGICDFVQGKWNPYLDDYPEFLKMMKNTQDLLESTEQLTPFPVKNRLCSIYSAENIGNTCFRLSFCLPQLKLKPLKIHKNRQIIQDITFDDIEMRPSAPWINKHKNGIMFTDELVKDSIDLKSEKSQRVMRNKKGQNRYKTETESSGK